MTTAARHAAVLVAVASGCAAWPGGERGRCPTDRVVEIGLQDDVQAITGCPRVAGLVVRTGATIDLAPLAGLEDIAGDLAIGPTVGVDAVALNGLTHVGGTVRVVSNGSLQGLFLPRLEQAGRIEVDGNVALTTISLPRLAEVRQSMVITDNHGLELVSATSLARIGGELVITGHPRLGLLELPRLAQLQAARLERLPQVAPEVLATLQGKAAPP